MKKFFEKLDQYATSYAGDISVGTFTNAAAIRLAMDGRGYCIEATTFETNKENVDCLLAEALVKAGVSALGDDAFGYSARVVSGESLATVVVLGKKTVMSEQNVMTAVVLVKQDALSVVSTSKGLSEMIVDVVNGCIDSVKE